ncbi:MAG: hypothetical protein O2960_05340 [Verrucomicrobia bacterium]|nr:hypothetical protein [Verrucomicrobiota bacterium]
MQKFDNGLEKKDRMTVPRGLLFATLGMVLGMTSGCIKFRSSEPKRTATEQLLLSTAADHAMTNIDVSILKGRKVFLNTTYFDAFDKEYVIGSIRDLLFSSDVIVVDAVTEADVVIEARSGAFSIDGANSLTGMPSLPFPVPFAGVVQTPEVSLYKADRQKSIAKFALVAYERESRKHVTSIGPAVGTAYENHYQILGFVKFSRTDIPQKKSLKWFQKLRK